MMSLFSVQFEVFGKVQGVFFRKCTLKQATALGLRGWVKNTKSGTVVGVMEGQEDRVGEMRRWLQNVGSPKSRIDNVEFTEEKMIEKLSFQAFEIRK